MRFRYVTGPDGSVDIADRGLAYGDGLFETIAIRHGAVQRFELHRDRLHLGCERLSLPLPERAELDARIATAAAGIERGSLKLILTRGSGPRGYVPPVTPSPLVILSTGTESAEPPSAISLASLRQALGENAALAGIKHLCRLEQVLGRLELTHRAADEGLMLSTRGHVIGGTSRNLFAVIGGTLVTPDLTRCGILGVMRRAVLERCADLGISCAERDILPAELAAADELFMTNALVGVQSVTRFDDRELPPGPLAQRLRDELELD